MTDRPTQQVSPRTDDAGTDHQRVREHDRIVADPDRAIAGVKDRQCVHAGAGLDRDALGAIEGHRWMYLATHLAFAIAEIGDDRIGVPFDDLPGPRDHLSLDLIARQ